jgi:hypothetical protein
MDAGVSQRTTLGVSIYDRVVVTSSENVRTPGLIDVKSWLVRVVVVVQRFSTYDVVISTPSGVLLS